MIKTKNQLFHLYTDYIINQGELKNDIMYIRSPIVPS